MACITSVRAFRVFFLFTSVAISLVTGGPANGRKIFDVTAYGARGDRKNDNTNAFSKAWTDACKWSRGSRVYIPPGTYKLGDVKFEGPCKGPISFVIKGTLLAPQKPEDLKQESWILFRQVHNLAVTGGGTLDGQGAHSWPTNDCNKNPNCRQLPMNMGFQSVKNSRIRKIRSLNSKMTHFNLFECSNIDIIGVTITAPEESPNTDGIKIGFSNNIRITNSNIGTGDDCIALLSGNSQINISMVNCGPGHGISVGSLGKYEDEKNVEGLTVKHCKFKGTDNGVRIKAWSSSASQILVSNFLYEDLHMIDVSNPIIIDQQYCPHPPCKVESESHIQIQDVKYRNIYGTSKTKVAVNLQCSKNFPCKNLELRDINLVHSSLDGPTTASCANVDGSSYGKQVPPACVR